MSDEIVLDGYPPSRRKPHKCPVCEGAGEVYDHFLSGTSTVKTTCHACGGTGIVWEIDNEY